MSTPSLRLILIRPLTNRLRVVGTAALTVLALSAFGLSAASANERNVPNQREYRQAAAEQTKFHDNQRELIERIHTAAKGSVQQVNEEHVAAAKDALRESLRYLESCLAKNKKYGQAWREFLQLEELNAQVNAGKPDLVVLAEIGRQFDSGHAGLESHAFSNVSTDLESYRRAVAASQVEDQDSTVSDQLNRLAAGLVQLEERPGRRASERVGESLAWFDRYGYAPELMHEVRGVYVQPNFYGHVSAELLAAGFNRPLHRLIPINNASGGARVTGEGIFDGSMTWELVPDPTQASFRIGFNGVLRSSTRGHRDPIGFASRGTTTIHGERFLTATAEGVSASPARIHADTSLRITNVWSKYSRPVKDRVATKIGSKRISEGKAASERSFSQRAEKNFAEAFEAHTDGLVAEANQSLINTIRVPLKQSDIYPQELSFSTTQNHLHVQASQAGPGQLAAFGPPPGSYPWAAMSFSVHESLINNTTDTALAGQEVESQQLAEVIERIAGSVPDHFASHEGTSWSLTMYDSAPLEVVFTEGGMKIKIRCSRITAGEKEYKVPFVVTANYLGSIRGNAIVFTRDGGVTMQAPGVSALGKLNEEQARSQAAIQERFEMLLSEEMAFTAAQLPFELPPGIELVPTDYVSGEGWMTVAFDAPALKQ